MNVGNAFMSYCILRAYIAMCIITLCIFSLCSSIYSSLTDKKQESGDKSSNISVISSVIVLLCIIVFIINYVKDSEFNCGAMITSDIIRNLK